MTHEAGPAALRLLHPLGPIAATTLLVWLLVLSDAIADGPDPGARFDFTAPNQTTVEEAIQRLGRPDSDHEVYVLEDEIDFVQGAPAPGALLERSERARQRGVRMVQVRVLAWDVPGRIPPVAKFVFRGERLWYARYRTPRAEATLAQLRARYGHEPHRCTVRRRIADVVHTVGVYAYPQLGTAYTHASGAGAIEHKVVFPRTMEHPAGLSCGAAGPHPGRR